MEQRQESEQRVARSEVDPGEDGLHFSQKIGMSEHHPFGVGGGSGGVKQGSQILLLRVNRFEIAGARFEDGGKFGKPVILSGWLGHSVRIHEDHPKL